MEPIKTHFDATVTKPSSRVVPRVRSWLAGIMRTKGERERVMGSGMGSGMGTG